MASSYMSTTQTVVSSKLCSGINSFSSCSIYTKNSRVLSTIRKGSINLSFHLDRSCSNQNTLKHYTRVRKLESDWEESKDEEKSDQEESEDEEKSVWEENKDEENDNKKEDHRAEETVLKLYTDIKDRNIKDDDYRAEETVLKLYTDIKDRNIDGISEVIGDECQFFSNFLPKYRLLQGKKRTMALAVSLAEKIVTFFRPAENPRRQAMTFLLLALLLLAAAAFYFTRLRF